MLNYLKSQFGKIVSWRFKKGTTCTYCGFLMKETQRFKSSLNDAEREALREGSVPFDRRNYHLLCWKGMFDTTVPNGGEVLNDIDTRVVNHRCLAFVTYTPATTTDGYETLLRTRREDRQYKIAWLGAISTLFAAVATWGAFFTKP